MTHEKHKLRHFDLLPPPKRRQPMLSQFVSESTSRSHSPSASSTITSEPSPRPPPTVPDTASATAFDELVKEQPVVGEVSHDHLKKMYNEQKTMFNDLSRKSAEYAEDTEIMLARIRRERNRHARENLHLSRENVSLGEEVDELRAERDDIDQDFVKRGKEIRGLQDELHEMSVKNRVFSKGRFRGRGRSNYYGRGRGTGRHFYVDPEQRERR